MRLTSGFKACLAAVAAVPGRVGPERPEEIDLAEGRPVCVTEVKFRICALPQQEAAEPLLAGGADDQVRVGLAGRVQVFGDVLEVKNLGELLNRGAPGRVILEQGADR